MKSNRSAHIMVSIVLLGMIGLTAHTAAQVRISADQAAGGLITKTTPPYPPIAKAARIQGTVVLQATISKVGQIEDLRVVSGPPLLQQAALEAVNTWRHKPFLLNGQPVEVETTVNVIFALGGGAPPSRPTAASADASTAQQNAAPPQVKDASFDILRAAVEKGDIQDASVWVNSANVDVNTHFDSGSTLLQVAVDKNYPAIVGLLLDHRAEVNANDSRGFSPLFIAANRGYADVASLLISHGADVNAKTTGATTPLHTAAYFGHTEIMKLLLSNHAELNVKDSDGDTPLHMAAEGGHIDAVKLLLARNAAINPLNNHGETPLGEARINGYGEIVHLLMQHGGTDPHAEANIRQLNDKIKQQNDKLAATKKQHEEFIAGMRRACRIYAEARQECATAGSFQTCMEIKNTGTALYKGSADSCNADGTVIGFN